MFVQPAPDLPEGEALPELKRRQQRSEQDRAVDECMPQAVCPHLLSVLGRLEKGHRHRGLQNAFVIHICNVANPTAVH